MLQRLEQIQWNLHEVTHTKLIIAVGWTQGIWWSPPPSLEELIGSLQKKWMVVMVHPFEESSSTFYRSNSDLKYLVLWRKKESSELRRAENSGKLNIWGIADKKRRVSHERFTKILYHKGVFFYIYLFSYDKLNYICIFICSYLWSIGGQMRINDIPINNV